MIGEANPLPPADAAAGMLRRYSTSRVALEMALTHRADYPMVSRPYEYWSAVVNELCKQGGLKI